MSMWEYNKMLDERDNPPEKQSLRNIHKWNHWPTPHNWITDIKVLVCNQDTFIAQFKLAFALAAEFFWSSFVPSPREVERKFFTGGYRCGFYLNVKIKSPIEILFGRGTNTVIGQIQSPFATGLFYFWVQQTALTALSSWSTLVFPQLYCEENVGDGVRRDDIGQLSQGFHEGVPGLGVLIYDKWNIMAPTAATVFFPPGYWSVYAAWIVQPSGSPITDLKLGLGLDGQAWMMDDMEDPTPGLPSTHITQESGFLPGGGTVSAWIQGSKPPGAFPSAVVCTLFTASWSPIPFDPDPSGLQKSSNPPYGRPGGDGAWAGPPLPPKCSEYS